MLKILSSTQAAASLLVDAAQDRLFFTDGGSIHSIPFAGGAPTQHQATGTPITGMGGNGHKIIVTDASGRVFSLDPANPSAPLASVAVTNLRLAQTAVSRAKVPTAAIVTSLRSRANPNTNLRPLLRWQRRTALTLLHVGTGTIRSIPMNGLSGVAIAGKSVYVGLNTGLSGGGEVAQLLGTTTQTVVGGLPPVSRIGVAENGHALLVCHSSSSSLTLIRPGTAFKQTVSTSSLPGILQEAQGLPDGRIAILTTAALAIIDQLSDLVVQPSIAALSEPIFVGSWAEVSFDLGTSGLSKKDVHFEVPDGPEAGFVSYARPNGAVDPAPLLIVGGRTGAHKLVLVENATSNVLATAEFEITDHWSDSDVGPPGCYMTASSFDGGAWGGGPNTPQNIDVHTHTGTWRSMVLMVDTSTRRWPTAAATLATNRSDILGHVVNGILFNGNNRSARQYYEENSAYVAGTRGLTLSVLNNQTYGPVNLPNAWTDYFEQKKDDDGNVIDDRWTSKGGTVQTIITRALFDGIATVADFGAIDVLIIVPFSADATSSTGARFVWPHAHDALEFLCGFNPFTDRRSFGYAFAPLDFDVHGGRQMHSTLSHELGHTLSLPDLYSFPEYSPDVKSRLTMDWDMMAGSRDALPHYSLSNKMRMGWIPAAHLRLFNFQGSGAITDTITLHAAELGDPPAGQFKGIEIRLGDGWNYYVEYRAEQPAFISDDVPTDRRVVITDVTSDSFTPPIARPPILLVRSDIDGDGPILGTGSDLEEKDPGTQQDLVVEVISTAADNAVVKVSYGSNGKPEPGIRPWSGGPSWQSPDIEVRNDRATADPDKYFNVPWLGHDNTIIAKVRNSGDLMAKGVVVDFFVTEYSSGDGPWSPLGFATQDIAAGATVEFSAPWNPSSADGKHYCVIVRIRLYQDPGNLAIVDQNIYNNEARSNYTKFVSASASPSSRVGTSVLLANPFDISTLVFAGVKQTHAQHRVLIEHQWLRVPGKGALPIRVWDEALWGTPEWYKQNVDGAQREPRYLWSVPNHVSIAGWAVRPFEADCGAMTLTGGVGMRVDAGRETKVELKALRMTYVTGQVTYVDNGGPVGGGTVLVEVTSGGKYFTIAGDVQPNGQFTLELRNPFQEKTETIEVHYLGAYSAAPSTTGPRPL